MEIMIILSIAVALVLLIQFSRGRRIRNAERSRWERINADAINNMNRAQERRSGTSARARSERSE